MFIANLTDELLSAMPIAPIAAPPPGPNSRRRPPKRAGVLDQGVGATGRHVHCHQRA